MKATLTKINGKYDRYACSLKGNKLKDSQGRALIQIKWKKTTQGRIMITIPKQVDLFLD